MQSWVAGDARESAMHGWRQARSAWLGWGRARSSHARLEEGARCGVHVVQPWVAGVARGPTMHGWRQARGAVYIVQSWVAGDAHGPTMHSWRQSRGAVCTSSSHGWLGRHTVQPCMAGGRRGVPSPVVDDWTQNSPCSHNACLGSACRWVGRHRTMRQRSSRLLHCWPNAAPLCLHLAWKKWFFLPFVRYVCRWCRM